MYKIKITATNTEEFKKVQDDFNSLHQDIKDLVDSAYWNELLNSVIYTMNNTSKMKVPNNLKGIYTKDDKVTFMCENQHFIYWNKTKEHSVNLV